MKSVLVHAGLAGMARGGTKARIGTLNAVRYCLFLCLLLAGCGTNLSKLLSDDSRLYWQADHIIQIAEPLDLGLEDAAYEAEAAQHRACRVVYEGAIEAAFGQRRASFFEKLWSSLKQVFVALVPIGPVERCARAQMTYRNRINELCRRLQTMAQPPDCPN